jgi:hypothetical protein
MKEESMDASTTAADATATQVVAKPAFQSYYKSPNDVDATMILFEKKPDKVVAAGVKISTFVITLNNPTAMAASTAPKPKVAGGRGGRGGRGGQTKLPPLALKPLTSLRTKYGINVGISQVNGKKDDQLINHLKENPRHVNAMAAGMIPTPPGVHFEIIFFLDPNEPEHQRLEQLSNECREQFETFVWEKHSGIVNSKLNINGFVRTSEKTDERYIVMSLSTMHTVEQQKFFPTPFYNKPGETILWDALVRHSFRAEIEFKMSHVMLVQPEKASFKAYVSSCTVIDVPKLAVSEAQQANEAYMQSMREAVRSAAAAAGPDTGMPSLEPDADSDEAKLAALTAKAEVAPKRKRIDGGARPTKLKKVPPPPPPSEASHEESNNSAAENSDPELAPTTPVPSGIIGNASRKR